MSTDAPAPPAAHIPRRGGGDLPPRPMQSLVAAARQISGRKVKRSTPERWQDEAWAMYDEVGELRFVASTLAAATSRARIFAATLPLSDEDPAPVDVESTDPGDVAARQAVQALGGGALGRAELIRRLVIQLFVPGDGYLIGLPPGILDTDKPTDDAAHPGITPEGADDDAISIEDLSWHALSVSEVQLRAGKVVLSIGDAEPRELDEDQVMLVRVWRPHPRRWWTADSPVRSNLPVLRELVGLTKHVGANIDSRLAGAGLLVIGNSVEVVGNVVDPETGAETPASGFVEALTETMTVPIADRDSAAAVVPLTIKVPDEVVDKVRHITFATPFDEKSRELRDEAIRRLALGLDSPPEVLLGLGDTNHWSAWQIEEATVKTHIEPLLALVADALTTDYLRPVLAEAGIERAREYVVWFDTTDLTLRPNRAGEAQALHAAGAISDSALRRESGFDEADAPDEADVDRAVETALSLLNAAPSLASDPGLPELVRQIREVLPGGSEDTGDEGPGDAMPDEPGDVDTGTELPDTQGDAPDGDPVAASSAPLTMPTTNGRGDG